MTRCHWCGQMHSTELLISSSVWSTLLFFLSIPAASGLSWEGYNGPEPRVGGFKTRSGRKLSTWTRWYSSGESRCLSPQYWRPVRLLLSHTICLRHKPLMTESLFGGRNGKTSRNEGDNRCQLLWTAVKIPLTPLQNVSLPHSWYSCVSSGQWIQCGWRWVGAIKLMQHGVKRL